LTPERFAIIKAESTADVDNLLAFMQSLSAKWKPLAEELLTCTPEQMSEMEHVTDKVEAFLEGL
jgi:hypothetical protein